MKTTEAKTNQTDNESKQSFSNFKNKQKYPKRHLQYKEKNDDGLKKVLRQEHKFLLDEIQYRKCDKLVSDLLKKDEHSGLNGYMVRTLYFDTLNDTDYLEKIDGVDLRRKIRLRIYDVNSEFANLELKQKQSIYQVKHSLKITREDSIQLSKGEYTPLLKYDNPFALECYTLLNTRGYVPKTIVQYNRKAYITYGNQARITLDRNLKATENCLDIFSENLSLYPVGDMTKTILEVKYSGFLFSYVKDMIQQLEKSTIAVSKYCMARSLTMEISS